MSGRIAALYRYPLKGFTPEPLSEIALRVGAGVAHDRAYAVEDGPSGFEPEAPAHVTKMRFTVLAKIPEVAQVRTRYDETTGTLHAEAPNAAPVAACLSEESGRAAFASWLTEVLGEKASGPLRVLAAPGAHRFYDHPQGDVSIINLESVRDLERRLNRQIDPLRFRANLYLDGWPAWSELDRENEIVQLGRARASVLKSIQRCVATHVDPTNGVRDLDMLTALRSEYGHLLCGLYLNIVEPGAIRVGDEIRFAA